MTEPERTEIEGLKRRQQLLEAQVTALMRRLSQLEVKAAASNFSQAATPPSGSQAPVTATEAAIQAIPAPQVERTELAEGQRAAATQFPTVVEAPPVIGILQPEPSVAARDSYATPLGVEIPGDTVSPPDSVLAGSADLPRAYEIAAATPATSPREAPPMPPPLVMTTAAASSEVKSFEMRVGTYWLVRIGIVMVLTGLVFFGNLAYHNFVSKLGPGGKVVLLYIASFLLLGAGAWWQRTAAKEALKNYAQVLFAGGLAAVYFTTYAAHHLPQLRVIGSQFLDGTLLLLWAGVIAWVADRKKSEVLAVFGVGLAYYSSVMTRVGHFTLYSNLVLAAAALYFLIRNRWMLLSVASLAATYGAYAFWRFFDGESWRWATPGEGLWTGVWFLMCYWAIFTAVVFLSRAEQFGGEKRAGFLTVNNGAFFAMFLLTMLQVREGGLWKFLLVYGTVLMAMAALAVRYLAAEPLVRNAYLSQGLLLVTIGLITKFAGLQLALLLAAESVVLLNFGQRRGNLVLLVGAFVTAGLSIGWGLDGVREFDRTRLLLGTTLGALMLVNSFQAHRAEPETPAGLRPKTAYFAVLALVIWWGVSYANCARVQLPLVLAAEGLALTLSIYLLRIREVSLLSQLYVLIGGGAWFFNFVETQVIPPWWHQVLLLGVFLCLGHWWQWQKALMAASELRWTLQGLYAAGFVGVVACWLGRELQSSTWMVVSAALAVGITVYSALTRAWLLAAFSQLLLVVSGVLALWHLLQAKPGWYIPLATVAGILCLVYGTRAWFANRSESDSDARIREPLVQLARVYYWAAVTLVLILVYQYVGDLHRVWTFAMIGLGLFLLAGWRPNRETLFAGGAFTAAGLLLAWSALVERQAVHWPDLTVIVAVLAQQRIARRAHERYSLDGFAHGTLVAVGAVTLWCFVSRWVLESVTGFVLTATWSGLALLLFGFGVVFRERMYRWVGLGILACSLGRVIVFDVWKLETLYRILSFMALGIVLLVLGFIYNKFQEKLREWL